MPPEEYAQLSRRERQIMDALYEMGEASAQQVLEHMPEPPSYSAVRALIARLVDKQVVAFKRDGNKHIYFPIQKKTNASNTAIDRLVKTFFKGSKINAVNALLNSKGSELTWREIEELERTIAKVKEKQNNKGK